MLHIGSSFFLRCNNSPVEINQFADGTSSVRLGTWDLPLYGSDRIIGLSAVEASTWGFRQRQLLPSPSNDSPDQLYNG